VPARLIGQEVEVKVEVSENRLQLREGQAELPLAEVDETYLQRPA
jgi:hypothetical protein